MESIFLGSMSIYYRASNLGSTVYKYGYSICALYNFHFCQYVIAFTVCVTCSVLQFINFINLNGRAPARADSCLWNFVLMLHVR